MILSIIQSFSCRMILSDIMLLINCKKYKCKVVQLCQNKLILVLPICIQQHVLDLEHLSDIRLLDEFLVINFHLILMLYQIDIY